MDNCFAGVRCSGISPLLESSLNPHQTFPKYDQDHLSALKEAERECVYPLIFLCQTTEPILIFPVFIYQTFPRYAEIRGIL